MTIVGIIERILTETLENTCRFCFYLSLVLDASYHSQFLDKTSKRNTASIRHKVCRLALMLGENYTRHMHKQNPDIGTEVFYIYICFFFSFLFFFKFAFTFSVPHSAVKRAEDSPHPLLALRKRLVASCSDFKGYIKLKCMQA
jgi:hypothetical protein